MALDGEHEVARVHAGAVVRHTDEREAAARRDDLDLARAGVDGVLDKLLDDARRALDDLAGRDAVDRLGCELPHGHECRFPLAVRGCGRPCPIWTAARA